MADSAEMERVWYGYGRWDAPYWFLGPEPGMADDGTDTLDARFHSWLALGGGELIGCREHHLGFGFDRWHRQRPALQPTWRQLIRLLLSFKGASDSTQAIRDYQKSDWGSTTGETCAIELSCLAARDLKVERDRERHRDERIRVLKERLLQYRPTFLVMYGAQRKYWEQVAGNSFDDEGCGSLGPTILLHAAHPTAWGLPNQYWTNRGTLLRQRSSLPPGK